MNENNEVNEWVRRADMDLATAFHMNDTFAPKPLEIICYHSQQAAEKIIKCYLVFHGIEPPKTHDIQLLLEKCLEINLDFDDIYNDATTLTNYAVRIRYPFELELTEQDAERALQIAKKVMDFVKSQL